MEQQQAAGKTAGQHRVNSLQKWDLERLLYQNEWHVVRAAGATASLLAFALPWIWQDGASSPTTGAGLMAYTFTGDERSDWVRQSFKGTLALNVLPWMAFGLALAAAVKACLNRSSLTLHTLCALTLLLLTLWAGEITSTAHRWGPLISPGAGIALLFALQSGLAAAAMRYWWRQHRETEDEDWEDETDEPERAGEETGERAARRE